MALGGKIIAGTRAIEAKQICCKAQPARKEVGAAFRLEFGFLGSGVDGGRYKD